MKDMKDFLDAVAPSPATFAHTEDNGAIVDTQAEVLNGVTSKIEKLSDVRNALLSEYIDTLQREEGLLVEGSTSDEDRRKLVYASQMATGARGQAWYLEKILREAGFPVNVVKNDPAKDPSFVGDSFSMLKHGQDIALCGHAQARMGQFASEVVATGNKPYRTQRVLVPGGPLEEVEVSDDAKLHLRNVDPNLWKYIVFIGGQTVDTRSWLEDANCNAETTEAWTANDATLSKVDYSSEGRSRCLNVALPYKEPEEIVPDMDDPTLEYALEPDLEPITFSDSNYEQNHPHEGLTAHARTKTNYIKNGQLSSTSPEEFPLGYPGEFPVIGEASEKPAYIDCGFNKSWGFPLDRRTAVGEGPNHLAMRANSVLYYSNLYGHGSGLVVSLGISFRQAFASSLSDTAQFFQFNGVDKAGPTACMVRLHVTTTTLRLSVGAVNTDLANWTSQLNSSGPNYLYFYCHDGLYNVYINGNLVLVANGAKVVGPAAFVLGNGVTKSLSYDLYGAFLDQAFVNPRVREVFASTCMTRGYLKGGSSNVKKSFSILNKKTQGLAHSFYGNVSPPNITVTAPATITNNSLHQDTTTGGATTNITGLVSADRPAGSLLMSFTPLFSIGSLTATVSNLVTVLDGTTEILKVSVSSAGLAVKIFATTWTMNTAHVTSAFQANQKVTLVVSTVARVANTATARIFLNGLPLLQTGTLYDYECPATGYSQFKYTNLKIGQGAQAVARPFDCHKLVVNSEFVDLGGASRFHAMSGTASASTEFRFGSTFSVEEQCGVYSTTLQKSFASPASPTNLYVSPAGLDTNDGLTSQTPFKSLDKALSSLATLGRNTLIVADGLYSLENNTGWTSLAGNLSNVSIQGSGQAIFSWNKAPANTVWTLTSGQTTVYQTARPYSAAGTWAGPVIDYSVTSRDSDFLVYAKGTSVATIAGNEGSWFADNSYVYVCPKGLRNLTQTSNRTIEFSSQPTVANTPLSLSGNVCFSGIKFQGLSSLVFESLSSKVAFENCSFMFCNMPLDISQTPAAPSSWNTVLFKGCSFITNNRNCVRDSAPGDLLMDSCLFLNRGGVSESLQDYLVFKRDYGSVSLVGCEGTTPKILRASSVTGLVYFTDISSIGCFFKYLNYTTEKAFVHTGYARFVHCELTSYATQVGTESSPVFKSWMDNGDKAVVEIDTTVPTNLALGSGYYETSTPVLSQIPRLSLLRNRHGTHDRTEALTTTPRNLVSVGSCIRENLSFNRYMFSNLGTITTNPRVLLKGSSYVSLTGTLKPNGFWEYPATLEQGFLKNVMIGPSNDGPVSLKCLKLTRLDTSTSYGTLLYNTLSLPYSTKFNSYVDSYYDNTKCFKAYTPNSEVVFLRWQGTGVDEEEDTDNELVGNGLYTEYAHYLRPNGSYPEEVRSNIELSTTKRLLDSDNFCLYHKYQEQATTGPNVVNANPARNNAVLTYGTLSSNGLLFNTAQATHDCLVATPQNLPGDFWTLIINADFGSVVSSAQFLRNSTSYDTGRGVYYSKTNSRLYYSDLNNSFTQIDGADLTNKNTVQVCWTMGSGMSGRYMSVYLDGVLLIKKTGGNWSPWTSTLPFHIGHNIPGLISTVILKNFEDRDFAEAPAYHRELSLNRYKWNLPVMSAAHYSYSFKVGVVVTGQVVFVDWGDGFIEECLGKGLAMTLDHVYVYISDQETITIRCSKPAI